MNAIGVFDSGLGGLTAVLELQKILPNEDVVYFGDTSRVPYGTRSENSIVKYAKQDIAFLSSQNVKIIVAACGTVSSVATAHLKLDVPLVGVVRPASIAATKATLNGKIGVIGTAATVKSKSYLKEIKKENPNFEVYQKPCPLFVPMVENGLISKDDPLVVELVKRYLLDLKEKGIDTLILGCTHYPILKDTISEVLTNKVCLINSGKEASLEALNVLKKQNLLSSKTTRGKISFYVSDEIENFKEEASKFLNFENYEIKKIDIEKF